MADSSGTDNAAESPDGAAPDEYIYQDLGPSDAELVERLRSGDERAFEELFNRHRRRVAFIAGRFFRQRDQIEDIIQESFTKAYFALHDFSGDREASFAAWLARIAFNTCYDELRRRRRSAGSDEEQFSEEEAERLREQLRAVESGGDIEEQTIAHDLAGKLLARLAPEDRLVLTLLEAEGLSVVEIARVMNWSKSKVKIRAHRARLALRRLLGKFL